MTDATKPAPEFSHIHVPSLEYESTPDTKLTPAQIAIAAAAEDVYGEYDGEDGG